MSSPLQARSSLSFFLFLPIEASSSLSSGNAKRLIQTTFLVHVCVCVYVSLTFDI